MEKSGRKVRITGKGRCNVTNARPAEEFADQVRTNAEFFKVAFSEFNNRAAIKFFERAGVKLDIERGDRVFPQSGKAWDIANALLEFCVENGVKIIYNTRVTEILTLGDRVFGVKYINRRGFERKEECAQVILATGGVSYPATGSTGDGYAFAADLGHTIEPLRPSLTPLLSSHAQMRYLDKVLLRNVRATLYVDNEPVREEFGEIGFSDRGIEGAVALRMSRDAVDALIEEKRVKLVLDLKPALTEEVLHERIAREIAELQPNEFFGELLRKLVPKPLVMPLAQEVDIRANCYVGKITEEQITRLVRTLKGLTFPITDYAPFEYAVVTAGGVRCDEVNPYTMESLKVKGLYFAGEVLDIDANTGGYNLQIAFSTGRLAGSLKNRRYEDRRPSHFFPVARAGFRTAQPALTRPLFPRSRSPFAVRLRHCAQRLHARRPAAGPPGPVRSPAHGGRFPPSGGAVAESDDSLRLYDLWSESCGC